MATIVQILLMLACVVYADEEYTNKIHFDVTDHKESSKEEKKPIYGEPLIPLSPTADKNPEGQLSFNQDLYSYNTKKTFDRIDRYREHTDIVRNSHKPENNDWPNNNNDYTLQKFNNDNNDNRKSEHMSLDTNQRLENKKDEVDISNMDREENNIQSTTKPDAKINIEDTKDYINNLFDNNRNDFHVPPYNVPGNIVVNSNGGGVNTVIHIDIMSSTNNVQSKPSETYPFSNSQPPTNNVYISIATSVPGADVPSNIKLGRNNVETSPKKSKMEEQLTNKEGNRPFNGQSIPIINPSNTNGQIFVTNPLQNNQLFNNYSPSTVLIYANGQLILVPGIAINPQQFLMPVNNGYQAYGQVQNPGGTVFGNGPNQRPPSSMTSSDQPRNEIKPQNVPTTDAGNRNMRSDNMPVGYPLPYNYNNNLNTPNYGVSSNANLYVHP